MVLLLTRRLAFRSVERLRGRNTLAYLKALEKTQWLEPDELQHLQLGRLIRHLAFAYARVPYYRKLLDQHGISPRRIQSFEDFQRIPTLTREDLRARFPELRARARFRGVTRLTIGHSTRQPVTVLIDRERAGIGDAARLRAYRWFGVELGAKRLVLLGHTIDAGRHHPLRRLRNRLTGLKEFPAGEVGETELSEYAETISRFRPETIHGPPSTLYLLARYLGETRWRPPRSLKVIVTAREPLYDFQRKMIQSVFDCPVSVEFSRSDVGLLANECPDGGLHLFQEGIYLEILGADSHGVGEIVVTNLDSFALPLIRYRTGEIGSVSRSACLCGRALPLLKTVEPRDTDVLVTPGGRVIPATSVIDRLRGIPGIREFRIIQDALDHLVVQLAPEPMLSADDHASFVGQLRLLMGNEVKIDLQRLSVIPRTSSETFRYVESKIALSKPDEPKPDSQDGKA